MGMRSRRVLADNLKRLRRERGLSQEALAFSAEIDRTYVSALERGIYAATIDMVDRLSDVLAVEPATMLTAADSGFEGRTAQRRLMKKK
jgi:transcriptional regulator with XRE-family HTH domain